MRVMVALLAVTAASFGQESHDHSAPGGGKVIVLPRDLEMRFAVNALPKVLRDGAAVLVLEAASYVKAKAGTNPFTCMVSRRGGNFYPVCFDDSPRRRAVKSPI